MWEAQIAHKGANRMDDDATLDVGPRKITARVAPFLDAIEAARKEGWSWADIALRVSPGASGDAVRIAVRECRYKDVEQRALPVLAAAPLVPKKTGVTGAAKPVASLARVGQKVVDSEDDGLTAAQRVLARIPKIGE
jgi:hypothetical protein